MKRLFLFFLMIGLSTPGWARLTAQFQPDTVATGQAAQLILTATEPFTEQPDLSALQQNFEIAGTQTRFSTTIVNGHKTTQYELLFNVFPLKTGILTVPPIQIGREKTEPIRLTVESGTTPAQQTPDITFNATTSSDTIYEGESLLYHASITENTGVFSAEIKPPHLENATIEQFSDDTTRLIYQNQKPARVLTRTYLITPHSTGAQTIQPARFLGQIPREQDQINSLSPFGSPMEIVFAGLPSLAQDILLTAKPLTLTVLPKPADYGTDWWLPARELTLNTLSSLPDTGRVGDPITVVFELIAIGTDANELPELTPPASPHFKIYANPAQRQNFIDSQDRFAGRLAQEINFIPLHAGSYPLPLPSLFWFNATTNQKEKATLPSHLITIAPSALSPLSTQTHTQSPDEAPPPSPPMIKPESSEKAPFLSDRFMEQTLKWGSTAAFFLLALTGFIAIILFIRKKRKNKKSLPDLYPY